MIQVHSIMVRWVSALFRDLGSAAPLYLLSRIAARCGNYVQVTPCLIVAQPVPEAHLLRPGRGAAITIKRISAFGPEFAGMPLTSADINRRLAAGAIGLAAYKGGTALGYQWVTLGTHNDESFCCRFQADPPSDAFDFDIYIRPEYRSGIAFLRLWDATFKLLRERGAHWTYSYISRFNLSSIAAHRRLGAIEVGRAVFIQAGKVEFVIASWRPRFQHATPNHRPIIRLLPPKPAAPR